MSDTTNDDDTPLSPMTEEQSTDAIDEPSAEDWSIDRANKLADLLEAVIDDFAKDEAELSAREVSNALCLTITEIILNIEHPEDRENALGRVSSIPQYVRRQREYLDSKRQMAEENRRVHDEWFEHHGCLMDGFEVLRHEQPGGYSLTALDVEALADDPRTSNLTLRVRFREGHRVKVQVLSCTAIVQAIEASGMHLRDIWVQEFPAGYEHHGVTMDGKIVELSDKGR